jgi:hypothetical protein
MGLGSAVSVSPTIPTLLKGMLESSTVPMVEGRLAKASRNVSEKNVL